MLDVLVRPAFLAPVVLLLGWVLYQLTRPSNLPQNLPIIGVKTNQWLFPTLRAAWRNTWNVKSVMLETYHHNKPAIVPLLTGPIVFLPASDTQWVADAPEAQLSMHKQVSEVFQSDFTMDKDIVERPIHHKLIVTTLTNQVGELVPDVIDEAAYQFVKQWGTDTEDWTEIGVYETMRHIVGSVTNRVFVGLPSCRDPALVDAGMGYAQEVPLSAFVLRCTPKLIKPFVAPLLTLRGRLHTNKFCNIIKPTIKRRLEEFDARHSDPEAAKHLGPVPNDWLQWSIAQAKSIGEPYLWANRKLAERILVLNFAAIHTTSFTVTSVILDLVCYNKPEYITELREEITSVLAAHDGVWTKRSLAKMVKLDSTLRESMRLNSFVAMGLGRKVTAKDGVDTPSGTHVPHGATVMVPSYSVLHDKAIYGEDADEFKPFRFAEQRADESLGYVEKARKAFPTTGREYLAFGHGRNACPGRFFASNEIKLLVGLVFLAWPW